MVPGVLQQEPRAEVLGSVALGGETAGWQRGVAAEVSGEVGLIVKAELCRHSARGCALQEFTAGSVDPAGGDVGMRTEPDLGGETADQVWHGPVQLCRSLGQGRWISEAAVEKVS